MYFMEILKGKKYPWLNINAVDNTKCPEGHFADSLHGHGCDEPTLLEVFLGLFERVPMRLPRLWNIKPKVLLPKEAKGSGEVVLVIRQAEGDLTGDWEG